MNTNARMASPGLLAGALIGLLLAGPATAASHRTGPQSAHHHSTHAAAHSATPSGDADLAYDDPAAIAARGDSAPAAQSLLSDATWHQSGMASWYGGKRWQGHATSSGNAYDEHELTAAHATLPIGSHVRVTDEGSGRSVVVLINDRPGTRSRIIDLSRGAANELGIIDRGVARVTLSRL